MAVKPVLKRFALQIIKDDGAGGLMPAAGAVAKFYKQGATVKVGIPIPGSGGSAPVQVYQPGQIKVGDRVQVGADGSEELEVTAADPVMITLTLKTQPGSSGVDLDQYNRLVRTKQGTVDDPALIYPDPLGESTGAESKTADAQGWVEGYVPEYRFDVTVTGGPAEDLVLRDQVGSFILVT